MFKEWENRLLNKLISDCITYNLKPNEALKYIEIEFGRPLSEHTYWHKRSRIQGEAHTNSWLNHFTKIGFMQHHRKLMDDLGKIQDDRLRAFFQESIKPLAERDESKLSQLNHDIRENAKLLAEFNLSTPVISSIKAKLEEAKLERSKAVQVISAGP